MGVLTDAMTRLHDEVTTLRDRRTKLIRDLERGALELGETVGSLRESNRAEQARSARQSRASRMTFVKGLAADVRHMQDSFAKTFARTSASDRKARKSFVVHQKSVIDGFCKAVSDDLAGARNCWQKGSAAGVSSHKKPSVHPTAEPVLIPRPSAKPATKAAAVVEKPAAAKQHARQPVKSQAPPAQRAAAMRGKAKATPAKTRKAGKR